MKSLSGMPLWIVCLIAGFFMDTSVYAEMRTWTSVEGQTMEATFVRLETVNENPEVVFRMSSGLHARVPLAQLSADDQTFIRNESTQRNARPQQPIEPEARVLTDFETLLARVVRYPERNSLRRLPVADFKPHQYYALYFSAEWCPPCRTFTPKLVEYYNQHKSAGADFQVIFVSSDRDDASMREYVSNYSMPFPVVEFQRINDVSSRVERWGRGIPNLVLLDRNGQVLFQSYEKDSGRFIGPTAVLQDLSNRLASN